MTRLAEIEAEMRKEEREAARWLRQHEGSLPGKSSAIGRSADRPQERVVGPDGRLDDRIVSLFDEVGGRWSEDDWEPTYSERSRFVPIQGSDEPLDLHSADISARVEHVLKFLPDVQVELLLDYCLNGVPWQELRNGDETKQAVYARVARAKRAFVKAFIEHAGDDVVLDERSL